mmetsp:Transcript_40421/g.101739  ORF Transcript_40421/g.101739 Transcript_40421/m.101739 type:complete len:253 (+) Transcript_40421:1879-2637(+)
MATFSVSSSPIRCSSCERSDSSSSSCSRRSALRFSMASSRGLAQLILSRVRMETRRELSTCTVCSFSGRRLMVGSEVVRPSTPVLPAGFRTVAERAVRRAASGLAWKACEVGREGGGGRAGNLILRNALAEGSLCCCCCSCCCCCGCCCGCCCRSCCCSSSSDGVGNGSGGSAGGGLAALWSTGAESVRDGGECVEFRTATSGEVAGGLRTATSGEVAGEVAGDMLERSVVCDIHEVRSPPLLRLLSAGELL